MMLKWKLKHAESETATISILSTPIKSGNIGRTVVTKVGWLVGRTDFLNKNIVYKFRTKNLRVKGEIKNKNNISLIRKKYDKLVVRKNKKTRNQNNGKA